MQPRFVGRFGLADAITVANAAVGFVAVVAATVEPMLAARLILLAAIFDALDGIVARFRGGTPSGEYLDSLADVASFGFAPAMVVYVVARDGWGVQFPEASVHGILVVLVPALFVMMAVSRLGMYTAYDVENHHTEGAPTTLGSTLIAASVLVGFTRPEIILTLTVLLSYLMVSQIRYPDLYPRDALIMGVVQAVAIVSPMAIGRAFPQAMLWLGLAYLFLSPRFYWRKESDRTINPAGGPSHRKPEGKRS